MPVRDRSAWNGYGKLQHELQTTPAWVDVTKQLENVTYIYDVLAKFRKFDFVQRILDPKESIPMPETGRTGTHFMVYGQADGRYWVYPRIVRGREGKLELLDENGAWNHAKKTGEMIPFSNKKQAEWFSYHYKDIWKGKFQQDGKSLRKY